jgi:UDP-3-O-acyl N-acetylglucosamine deacetylase
VPADTTTPDTTAPATPPSPRLRATLSTPVSLSGRGVHSGISAEITLAPAEPGTGYVFCRTDLPDQPRIPATYDFLATEELDRRTTLRTGNAAVHTIEHVLSALVGAGVDDCLISLTAAEPPFLDGSALPYAEAIERAGIISADDAPEVSPVSIDRPLVFSIDGAEICAIPSPGFQVSFFFTSSHPRLRSQAQSVTVTPEAYLAGIAPARTFCFFEEIETLRKAQLIKGANLGSAVVIGRKATLNDSLRFDDEPVRHKILDFIGDMALLGAPLQGHFLVWRGGHRVNAAFGKYLKKELNL